MAAKTNLPGKKLLQGNYTAFVPARAPALSGAKSL